MYLIKEDKGNIFVNVKVQPRASKNEVCGIYGDRIKIKLTAPPVEGEANEKLREFLAEKLEINRGCIEIITGHRGKNKLIKVVGIKKERFENLFS
ncbi:MAG: YggU family protein [Nitrospinae bacterium RIFCSPLOWO2_02_FULL_39_110]|nr:MAG: YggU family protein [Nitrospinae bacterium RIFCSPHIGHO2_02_39_11]OGV98577.1 MAG: YggU family protein [Nitrospinae bacterium RIFCSPHIGHO2_12_FULL_39_42]OGW00555.1 MAG: YggU family protein [Nitrospinae bacterium RIFCSPHIGHO2_02_FULL_39_82]OGW01309.1 MAG: YggU family protein [Nitrospinae bacterium RIFCSPLOWO2_02_39_17]OGW04489.1 MAG: YggU family protein [Nitrospinae bacterium RIFCSPLOWO2_02_FULL_39_110]OGW09836.1 MAG: YggU family protein [Nitrospinae bacterium RIFCSPLOWO2_12_FULL_39_93]O